MHSQWLDIAEAGLEVFVKRVGTDDNIGDLPSRMVRCSLRQGFRVLLRFVAGLCPVASHGCRGNVTRVAGDMSRA